MLSEIENCVSLYSEYCKYVKYIPRRMVILKENTDSLKLFFTIEWCDSVIDTPLLNRIIVFKSGTSTGLSGEIMYVGQLK